MRRTFTVAILSAVVIAVATLPALRAFALQAVRDLSWPVAETSSQVLVPETAGLLLLGTVLLMAAAGGRRWSRRSSEPN